MRWLIDENLSIPIYDFSFFDGEVENVNSIFRQGEEDEFIIHYAKETKATVVTKDVRMTIIGLTKGVPILFVNQDYGIICLIKPQVAEEKEYQKILDYFKRKLK